MRLAFHPRRTAGPQRGLAGPRPRGFDTDSTVPLRVGVVQLAPAWLAGREVRPPVGFVAAVLLSTFCLTSLLFGSFDGDLAGNTAPARYDWVCVTGMDESAGSPS